MVTAWATWRRAGAILLRLLAAAAVGVGLYLCVQAEPPMGSIEGVLIARDSGRPARGATISLSGMAYVSGRADEEGRFRFADLPVGGYVLSAETPGHRLVRPVAIAEGPRKRRAHFEMVRRPSHVNLVLHHDVLYPGEPVAVAVSGLALDPSYHLDIYAVQEWRHISEGEAIEHAKALEEAIRVGDIASLSSTVERPPTVDWEGMFYHRPNVGVLPTGRYLIVATGETGCRSAGAVTISRLGLLVKSDREQSVGYVTDLRSGIPIEGARFSANGRASLTDADGLARLRIDSLPGSHVLYTAEAGDDVVSFRAGRPQRAGPRYRLYAFTDRPIYRPGDRVQYKGVVRRQDGVTYELPGETEVKLTVTDPDGLRVHETTLTTNLQGSFAGLFDLPKFGRTGWYGLRIRVGSADSSLIIRVASYLKPEMQLTARPEKPQVVRGERAEIVVEAGYYFGAPAAGVDVHWTLQRDLHYPDFEYGFEEEYYGGEFVAQGEARTGDDGTVRIALPTRLRTAGGTESPYWDYVYRVSLWSYSDAGGSAEAETTYLVTRGDFRLGLQPDRYVLAPGSPAQVTVEARDFQGDAVGSQTVRLTLIAETEPKRRGNVKRVSLRNWTVTTGDDGTVVTSLSVPTQGTFVLEAETRDAAGRAIASRLYLWAYGGGTWSFGEGQAELSIVSDRKEYGERDHVKLLVTAQREGPALFCVEGDKLHEIRPVQLHHGANLIELEMQPEFVPNAFVWVGQVYGKRLHQASKELPVSRETRRLTVKVIPGASDYRPGDQAVCAVEVADARGQPAQAEVCIGVVDEGIYALAEDQVEDPADFFYRNRWNSVRTDFAPTGRYLGGGDKAPAGIDIRRKFVDTAFWAPFVMTDEKGRAEVSFTLPDNLTSWRVTARAVSADTRGGQARATFEVNKPLMVRLDLPRFATQTDRFRVSAYVHNETDREQQVALDSWARGIDLDSRRETFSVGPRKAVRRDWWATATAAGGATIGAAAVAGPLNDGVELVLPIQPLTKTQFDAWSGETEGRAEITFSVRDDSIVDRARLVVAFSPSLAASLFSSLDYLVGYPHGCVEQTVSRFLPDIYVLELLKARGLGDIELAQRIPRMVTEGLARLSSLRQEEGAWGWGRWGEMDIWMTSYALLAIQEARAAGYPAVSRPQAVRMLENAVRAAGVARSEGDAQVYQRYEYPDDLAFTAYVLARSQSDLALATIARALADRKVSGRGRALCALAYFELGEEAEAQALMEEIWRTAKPEGKWLYWSGLQDEESRWWDGGAGIEATAWSLKAGLRADPEDPRNAAVAGWLLEKRRGDRWVSTRDTAIALMALVEHLRHLDEPNPDYTAVVQVNGKEVLRQTFTRDPKTWREVSVEVPVSSLRTGANRISISQAEGTGRLYYRADLRQQVLIREGESTARGDILKCSREYFKVVSGPSGGRIAEGAASRPGDRFDIGDRVLVRLTLRSKQRLRYALVEDPLPAGLEPNARGEVGFMDWRSWWVDNDVRDDRVIFYLDWLPVSDKPGNARVIEYVVTARTPGRFSAPPPTGFAMYQPELNAVGEPARVEVRE